MSEWISVKDKLPEPEQHVLIFFDNKITTAIYMPEKYKIDDEDCDILSEYHEDKDTWYWPGGWYEYHNNPECEHSYIFYGCLSPECWQPLPEPPED